MPTEPSAAPQLRVYDWRTEEYLLIDLYNQLITSGDMATTFAPDMRYLSTFLTFFRGGATMGYASDNNGIFFASWVQTFLAGGFFGVWIRKDKRHTVTALRLLTESYNECFKVYTVLLGICKQEHLREVHEKLGYKRLAEVPALWNGESVDIYAMTKDMWENRHGHERR